MANGSKSALGHLRICDFTGQLAGAGSTRWFASFGAEVIRIEDPVNEGKWDVLRGNPPYPPGRPGLNTSASFNTHNLEKLGVTLNLRTERAKELLRELISVSDMVTENFSAGVLKRWGFSYEAMREIKPDIIYVSNCGFGHVGPYGAYKTFGPIVQAVSGLTFESGLPDMPSAGWGYSYMDHTGGYMMAISMLAALHHRAATGEGQWVDMSCTEAGAALTGPAILDYTVNDRPLRRPGSPNSNRSQWPPMAPHGIYAARGEDEWVALACQTETDWESIVPLIGETWANDTRWTSLAGRLADEDELDVLIGKWTADQDKFELAARLQAAGIAATAVQRPEERIDHDANTEAWGLWPEMEQTDMGRWRVDGQPVHMSETDWSIERGAPNLGEHNERIFGDLLGHSKQELEQMKAEGVI